MEFNSINSSFTLTYIFLLDTEKLTLQRIYNGQRKKQQKRDQETKEREAKNFCYCQLPRKQASDWRKKINNILMVMAKRLVELNKVTNLNEMRFQSFSLLP